MFAAFKNHKKTFDILHLLLGLELLLFGLSGAVTGVLLTLSLNSSSAHEFMMVAAATTMATIQGIQVWAFIIRWADREK
jgi:hypothetical protein